MRTKSQAQIIWGVYENRTSSPALQLDRIRNITVTFGDGCLLSTALIRVLLLLLQ
jgi:hypothetical protein